MMFILRTIFWLSVALAIVPARSEISDSVGEIGREAVRAGTGAVAGYCTGDAGNCLDGIARIIRIGEAASANIAAPAIAPEMAKAPKVGAVPLPVARPQG